MRIHFLGIGGIGVSALAQYYLARGHKVTGSDLVSSEITDFLKRKGIKITIGSKPQPKAKELPDLVIYSPAVPKDHPELLAARRCKIKTMSYPEALGEITKKYFTIAVSGTHGKSTTTAMIAFILVKAGLDPTVIVGTKLKEFGNSNFRIGQSKYLVIEADEHMASFLNYRPKVIVVTNIEPDHLDYYKNFKNYALSFKKFVSNLPKDGTLIINKDVKHCNTLATIVDKVLAYSLRQKERRQLVEVLKVPGEHNVSNALAALAAARVLGIPDKVSYSALAGFMGTWRRFEEKDIALDAKRYTLISDYAHHPTEIKTTLMAAREKYPKQKIWCIFQPHQYQRTYYLWKDFIKIFRCTSKFIDKIIITDIYDVPGREKNRIKASVNSQKLVRAVDKPNIIYVKKEDILKYCKKNLEGGEIVIFMGAGDIYELGKKFSTGC